jgi:ATP-dependent DNA ligase
MFDHTRPALLGLSKEQNKQSPHLGIVLNEIFEGDADVLFEHACKLGFEGIVSKGLARPVDRAARRIDSKSKIRTRQR